MKRISDEEIQEAERSGCQKAIKPNPLLEIYQSIADAQLAADKKVIEQMIEETKNYDGSYIDKRFWQSQFWLGFKKKYLGE